MINKKRVFSNFMSVGSTWTLSYYDVFILSLLAVQWQGQIYYEIDIFNLFYSLDKNSRRV